MAVARQFGNAVALASDVVLAERHMLLGERQVLCDESSTPGGR